jgi:hypothetical protein
MYQSCIDEQRTLLRVPHCALKIRTSSKAPSKALEAAEIVPADSGVLEDLQALKAVLSIDWISIGLSVQWETVEVSLKDAYRIRRRYSKIASLLI